MLSLRRSALTHTLMILVAIDYRLVVPEQMSAETDDRVSGGVQADVALESGSVPLAFRASARTCSASATRDSRSSGGRAVTRAPLLLCGLHPLRSHSLRVHSSAYLSSTDVTPRQSPPAPPTPKEHFRFCGRVGGV